MPLDRKRADRLWMAGIWLFFAAVFLGVTLWKAPEYARLYAALDLRPPGPTAAVLAVSSIVGRLWFVALPLMLVPLALIARGAFDGKTGPFVVAIVLALFVVVSFSSIFLFAPVRAIQQRIDAHPPSPPP